MIKRMPIRLRLTLLTMLILSFSCLVLTITINFSAFRMAESIVEATPIGPSYFDSAIATTPSQAYTAEPPLVEIQLAKKGFKIESFIALVFIIIAGGFITYRLSGKALEPLEELNKQMKNRTIENLAEELEVPQAKDEIADLTNSFNHMIVKLNDSFLMQKRFSQNAAHELRTPLAVLKTKIDVFKKKQTHTEEEYDSLLSVLSNHTQRLYELVKNLLDMSNLEDMAFDQILDVHAIAQTVLDDLSSIAQKKKIEVSLSGDHAQVLGNSVLLYRAFYNLVENGCRYSDEYGLMQIQILVEQQAVKIKFIDGGYGIPDDKKADVFEPFFRVDKSRARKLGGTGLGLALVHEIVKHHHGMIQVEDNTPQGSIFTISLPFIEVS